jgi:predicted nucleic acid-binding protein
MALVLFDTNILIDALKGYELALDELEYWDEPAISVITWMEIIAGADGDERASILKFLEMFEVIHTNDQIMMVAADVRRTRIVERAKIALPDTIILATGALMAQFVVTRNTKDFRYGNVRVPYELTPTDPVQFINIVPPPGIRPPPWPLPSVDD